MSEYVVNRLAKILDRASGNDGERRLNLADIETMTILHSEIQPRVVVDIGTYKGKSAKIWKWLGAEKVYSIDREPVEVDGIECLTGDSGTIPWSEAVDLVWVDGDHSYGGVMADLRKWMPLAGKMICGHDYHQKEPDVIRAVDEFFGKIVKVRGIIWSVDKR